MDPNHTLQWIDSVIRSLEQGDEIDEWCQSLFDWLEKGGFEPYWNKYPSSTSYYYATISK